MDFIKWVEEHGDEYGVKLVPLSNNPEERERQIEEQRQMFDDAFADLFGAGWTLKINNERKISHG